jgi:hypothetical protein
MAGEWIPIDIGIWQKPEVQELVDLTGASEDSVVARLVRMWGWASIHTADGTIRATPDRLARLHGGDQAFWLAVESVGWITFDKADGTVTIAGWEKKFSRAAKARAEDRIRKSAVRQSDSGVCPESVRNLSGEVRTEIGLHNRTVQEKTVQDRTDTPPLRSRVSSGDATRATADGGDIQGIWETFRQAWNGTTNTKPWNALGCPSEAIGIVTDPAFVQGYPAALERLRASKFFADPAALTWFLRNWSRVLAGEFDGRTERGVKPKRRIIDLEEEPV